jgi:hypothetical protein
VAIYRRLMMRIAEALAGRSNAQALVTGDVVDAARRRSRTRLVKVSPAASGPEAADWIRQGEIMVEAERLGPTARRSFQTMTAARCSH